MQERFLGFLVEGLMGRGFGPEWRRARIGDLAIDSRSVRPGSLFVGLPGSRVHGADHVQAAHRAGAAAVLVPDDWGGAVPAGVRGFAARDITRALAVVAARFYGEPGRRLRLSAVTGTNGKTTVVWMLAHLLKESGRRPVFWSTAFVDTGQMRSRPRFTTPPAPDLHRFLAEALERGATDAVMEVSSHAVVLNRIYGLPFKTAVATNLSPDHLDFHPSLEAYAGAKRGLFEALSPDASSLLNRDDEIIWSFRHHTRSRTLSFGFHPEADVRGEILAADQSGTRLRLHLPDSGPRTVHLQIPGRHNVANALAAAGAAWSLGVPAPVIGPALERFRAPVRRLEADRVGPYTVVNDVAMNRASYEAVLGAMEPAAGSLVVVNAVRGNRGTAVNRDIAEILGSWNRKMLKPFAPLIVTTSDGHVAEFPDDYQVRPEELDAFLAGCRDTGLGVEVFRELPRALEAAINRLGRGGTVLLLGTFGMDDGPALAVAMLEERLIKDREDAVHAR